MNCCKEIIFFIREYVIVYRRELPVGNSAFDQFLVAFGFSSWSQMATLRPARISSERDQFKCMVRKASHLNRLALSVGTLGQCRPRFRMQQPHLLNRFHRSRCTEKHDCIRMFRLQFKILFHHGVTSSSLSFATASPFFF